MSTKLRFKQKLKDFNNALNRLEESLNKKNISKLEQDGIIQRFEFSFELAWKTLKSYLEQQGFSDLNSPKNIIRKAFQVKLIENGDLWFQMLDDRNSLSHMYDQKMSDNIFSNIAKDYIHALKNLITKLKIE